MMRCKIILASWLFSLGWLLVGCSETIESSVPNLPVYYPLDFTSALAKPLLAPGGSIRITERLIERSAIGFGGLLVVHSLLEPHTYYAYDLACAHEANAEIQLYMNEKIEAVCPACGSTYSVLYGGGAPTSGVAQKPLRSYRITPISQGILIHN